MGTNMIDRNFIAKMQKIFSEHNAKNFAWKVLTIIEKSSNIYEMISLIYDVNDRVYSKSKYI